MILVLGSHLLTLYKTFLNGRSVLAVHDHIAPVDLVDYGRHPNAVQNRIGMNGIARLARLVTEDMIIEAVRSWQDSANT